MRFCAVLLILLTVAGCAGCRERSVPPAQPPPEIPPPTVATDAPDPYTILNRMVIAYRATSFYSDRAAFRIIGKMSQPDIEPPSQNCSVTFQNPDRLRLEINKGVLVSDGEYCYAQIQSVPNQILRFPAPADRTLEMLFQDVPLDAAMTLELPHSVLRFPPQLVLLFANNPLNTFCPRGASVEWYAQQQIDQIACDVIRISHSDGQRLLWISQDNYVLLRMDYLPFGLPVPEGFESIEVIRFEMTDAQFAGNFVADTFQLLNPQDAVQVTEFHSNTPGLPTPEEHRRRLKLMTDNDLYRLVDQYAESAIYRESASSAEQPSLPTAASRTFTLSQIWTQPLFGVDTIAILPGEPPLLLVPCEGNVVAVLDLQGNVLQKKLPEGLEDTVIMDIQSNTLADARIIGILTLNNTFYLFDETFKPLPFDNAGSGEDSREEVRYFRFIPHRGEELLFLGVSGLVRAVDAQGTTRWEYAFDGEPNQISSAMIEDQLRVFVSCSALQDSILMLSPEGTAFEPVEIAFGRHVLWFQVVGSTIYALYENTDTGDVRFGSFDFSWKSQWSRLLPFGEYMVDPVYVSGEQKWLVPSPDGRIFIFDLIGNMETFSLDGVLTGLFCLELAGAPLLIVTDGKTVSAWKIRK